jgi:peptide/nickel transport system permease protein
LKAYIARRLLLMIPSFIGISIVTFLLIQSVPGSPVYMRLRSADGLMRGEAATEEIIQQTKALYGLDKPIHVQYVTWLGKMIRLDFGKSYKDGRPVLEKIGEALPITLQLSVLSIFITYLVAVPAGVFSATRRGSWADSFLTLILFILYSLPSFWVAMLLMMFLGGGTWWNLFPIAGMNSLGAAQLDGFAWLMDRVWHLVLPLVCFTYAGLAGLSRYMRTGMLEVIRQDYVRTARAYGFSEKIVTYKYALRNAVIPMITLLAGLLPAMIGGSVIIESIFSLPGMGRLMFEAMLSRDYPLIMGEIAIGALLTMFGLLLSDVLYAFVDPRIKLD